MDHKSIFSSFYSEDELNEIKFASFGKNVLISRKCSIYSPQDIKIGDNVRIDDFCILSGNIELKNNIHISAYCSLYGGGGIFLDDFTGLSPRSTLLSASDDFSGEFLIGPVHSHELINVQKGEIQLMKFSQLGAHSVVLPNVVLEEGAVTGAMTLVTKSLLSWSLYVGCPAKKIKDRTKGILSKMKEGTYKNLL